MAQLTWEQRRQAAIQAGWPPALAIVAASISMAEAPSGTDAHNTQGEDSRGLMQVNAAAWPQLAQRFNLFDAVDNMRAALEVYKIQGWDAWTTYTPVLPDGTRGASGSGVWRRYVPADLLGTIQAGGQGSGDSPPSQPQGGNIFDSLSQWIAGRVSGAVAAVGLLDEIRRAVPEVLKAAPIFLLGLVAVSGGVYLALSSN